MEQGYTMPPYGVYVRADEKGRIVDINSDAFLESVAGWTKIDEGYGDKHHHAQGNYLPGPLMDGRGVYRYKLTEGEARERTQEEMDGDYTPPIPGPSLESRMQSMESAMEALMGGIGDA